MILKYMKDDIASLDLSFSINEDVVDQETQEVVTHKIDLKYNGEQIPVTK